MTKIVLIFPRIDEEKEHHHLPVSTLSLAAPLEKAGYDYSIWDQRISPIEELDALLSDAEIVGLTMFTGFQTHCGYELLKRAKKSNPNIISIIGGPHVTALPQQTADDPYVDFAVEGFGEETFIRMLNTLSSKGSLTDEIIPGLYQSAEARTVSIDPKKLSVEQAKFDDDYWEPLPYHKIKVNDYINPETGRVMYVAHYGCPAKCTFCATPHYRKWTAKPLDLIKKDLDQIWNTFNFKEMCFFDATLFTRKDRVNDIIDLLDPYPNVNWMADARAVELNKYSTDELKQIRDKKAELDFLIVGLESGSERIAEDVMKKGKKHLDMYRTVTKRIKEADIKLVSGLIFGIPGETHEDLYKTIDFVSEIRDIHPGFSLSSTFFRPLPGTELYELLDDTGYIAPKSLKDWAEYGASSHFRYNEWMDVPWLDGTDKELYRKAYDKFIEVHAEILV